MDNTVYDEILVKPTQDDLSIMYKTVFDDDSNSIDFTTTISTKKPKSKMKNSYRLMTQSINYVTFSF